VLASVASESAEGSQVRTSSSRKYREMNSGFDEEEKLVSNSLDILVNFYNYSNDLVVLQTRSTEFHRPLRDMDFQTLLQEAKEFCPEPRDCDHFGGGYDEYWPEWNMYFCSIAGHCMLELITKFKWQYVFADSLLFMEVSYMNSDLWVRVPHYVTCFGVDTFYRAILAYIHCYHVDFTTHKVFKYDGIFRFSRFAIAAIVRSYSGHPRHKFSEYLDNEYVRSISWNDDVAFWTFWPCAKSEAVTASDIVDLLVYCGSNRKRIGSQYGTDFPTIHDLYDMIKSYPFHPPARPSAVQSPTGRTLLAHTNEAPVGSDDEDDDDANRLVFAHAVASHFRKVRKDPAF